MSYTCSCHLPENTSDCPDLIPKWPAPCGSRPPPFLLDLLLLPIQLVADLSQPNTLHASHLVTGKLRAPTGWKTVPRGSCLPHLLTSSWMEVRWAGRSSLRTHCMDLGHFGRSRHHFPHCVTPSWSSGRFGTGLWTKGFLLSPLAAAPANELLLLDFWTRL